MTRTQDHVISKGRYKRVASSGSPNRTNQRVTRWSFTMPTSLPELYLHQIRISTAVLQFDISAGYGLTVWRWYVQFMLTPSYDPDSCRPTNDAGERVPPSELGDHRLSHRFLGPCCICPILTNGEVTFTEAAIFMETSGRRAGQYLARCARDSCGYLSKPFRICFRGPFDDRKPVPLESVYPKLGVPLRLYPRRGKGPADSLYYTVLIVVRQLSMKSAPNL
jgi:hypothetical protein